MKPASHESIGIWRVVSGWVRRCSKTHGPGRVGSGVFNFHRSGRVRRFLNITDRVGLDQEAFEFSRVGLGHVKTSYFFRGCRIGSDQPTRPDPTREV